MIEDVETVSPASLGLRKLFELEKRTASAKHKLAACILCEKVEATFFSTSLEDARDMLRVYGPDPEFDGPANMLRETLAGTQARNALCENVKSDAAWSSPDTASPTDCRLTKIGRLLHEVQVEDEGPKVIQAPMKKIVKLLNNAGYTFNEVNISHRTETKEGGRMDEWTDRSCFHKFEPTITNAILTANVCAHA